LDLEFGFRGSVNKKVIRFALGAMLLALCFSAQAQQPVKAPRVGVLSTEPSVRIDAFRHGLRQLGYIEGKTLIIESRFGGNERLQELAAELVRLKIDVIFAPNTTDVEAAKKATSTTPIVFASAGDPVGSGFIVTLARPGGNITGLTSLFGELSAKRLELLKEVLPMVTGVAVLANPALPFHPGMMRTLEDAAKGLKVHIRTVELRDPKDLDMAFEAVHRERADALLVLPNPMNFALRHRIAELALRGRIPSILVAREYAEAGGLIAYGADLPDLYRRAATYVDKILKGAKPAELPVEQPTKFELVINLETAKKIGVTIPQSVLYRADKLIK
jgi:putative ABC transport system substrate-binding protein